MFASKFLNGFKGEKKIRTRRVNHALPQVREIDIVTEQVKQVLQAADQKLILMVRG